MLPQKGFFLAGRTNRNGDGLKNQKKTARANELSAIMRDTIAAYEADKKKKRKRTVVDSDSDDSVCKSSFSREIGKKVIQKGNSPVLFSSPPPKQDRRISWPMSKQNRLAHSVNQNSDAEVCTNSTVKLNNK